tara:strand:+ start:147 stop:620 length:474 start_codon:yes stop_codon:yes gene_type:complete
MSNQGEKKKVYYKRKVANWRKRYLYDYLGGELGKETRMIQYTHTMLEDIIFDLGQQNKFLSFHKAVKKYKINPKHIDYLLEEGYFYLSEDKSDSNNRWIFSKNITENLKAMDDEGKKNFKNQSKRKDRQHIDYVIENEKEEEKERERKRNEYMNQPF